MYKKLKKKAISFLLVSQSILSSTFCARAINFVVDPGHGGEALGAVYQGVIERDVNLIISKHLKKELKKYRSANGETVGVYLTREKQEDNPTLEERVKFGVDKKAEAVISIHNNASGANEFLDSAVSGCSVLVTNSHFNGLYEVEEKLGRNVIEKLGELGIEPLRKSDEWQVKEQELREQGLIPDDVPNVVDRCIIENGLLHRLSTDKSVYKNGDTTDWYGIIRHGVLKKMPSVIVECCYLNSKFDYENFLSDDTKLENIAKAIAKAIAKTYNLALPEQTSTKTVSIASPSAEGVK